MNDMNATKGRWRIWLLTGLGIFSVWFLGKLIISSPIPVLPDLTIDNFHDKSIPTVKLTNMELTPIDEKVKGVLFVQMIIDVLDQELNHGWLPNDIFPSPTVLLDNRPNFQLGVWYVLRETVRILRDNLSRMRTTDSVDSDVDKAFVLLSNDPEKWILPSAETKYTQAIESLKKYQARLINGQAKLFPRSDNLIQLINVWTSIMGGVNNRLLNTAQKDSVDIELAGDKAEGQLKRQMMISVDIPWYKMDDNFYYVNGIDYALYHLLLAVRKDFDVVIKDKNADPLVNEVLRKLSLSNFSPWITFFADRDSLYRVNHSLNMSAYFNDARQKLTSFTTMLDLG
jgi:hypothetical protein